MQLQKNTFLKLSASVSLWLILILSSSFASTNVVISEVMHGVSGSSNKEFIELYNNSDTDIDLQNVWGLELKFVNSSNYITNKNITWINSTIPAHGYFLFVSSTYNDAGESDAIFSYGITSNAGVIIALSSGSYIDRVGWGTGSDSAVEGTAVGTFNTGQSIERLTGSIAGSDTDTNNNYNDFVIRNTPQKQSSASYKTPYQLDIIITDTIYQYTEFEISLICKDYTGETVTDFNDTINLSLSSGVLSPSNAVGFSNGVFNGDFTVSAFGSNIINAEHYNYSVVSDTLNINVLAGNFETGVISITTEFNSLNDTANITLIDSDLNTDTTVAETVAITVTSTVDTMGIEIILQEINANTSVFTFETLELSLDTSDTKIQVKASGDTITLTYNDQQPALSITEKTVYNGFQIKINEIVIDPNGTDQGNEWIELYNADDESIDVTDWAITDENAGTPFTIPALIIPAKNYVVCYIDTTGINDTDFSDSKAIIYSGETTTLSLTNSEDQISLYTSSTKDYSTIVDFIQYCSDGELSSADEDINAVNAGIWTDNTYINTSNLSEGQSIILTPDGNDNNLNSDWTADNTPTKGFTNQYIYPPTAPANLSGVAGYEIVSLAWDASQKVDYDITGYNIYRSQTSVFTDTPINTSTTNSYSDVTVENDTVYYYKISAVDTSGLQSGFTNVISCTPLSTVLPPDNILVTEIMYNPSTAEPENEWVELYNPEDTAVSLSGCSFGDGDGEFIFPDGTIILSKTYFVLTKSSSVASYDLIYGDSETGSISFSNTGDQVLLKKSDGDTIQFIDYGQYWAGEQGNKIGSNVSLSRKYMNIEENNQFNWAYSQDDGGTPKAVNNVDTVSPVLTHTPFTQTIANRDMFIHFESTDQVSPTILSNAKIFYKFNGDTQYTQEQVGKIYNGYTERFDASVMTADTFYYYLYIMDDSNNDTTYPQIDPETNPVAIQILTGSYPTICINEIMYDPGITTDPSGEWIELYNPSADTIDISGWTFTDLEGSYTIPDTTYIPGHGYLVMGHDTGDLIYGSASVGNINLANIYAEFSEELILKDTTGLIIEEVNYSSEWGANNANGPNNVTLERIETPDSPNIETNWKTSFQNGGTPGEINSGDFLRNVEIENTQINPSNGETAVIKYELTENCTVTITISDTQDNVIKTLIDAQFQTSGTQTVNWDGKDSSVNYAWGVVKISVTAANEQGQIVTDNINEAPLNMLYEDWLGDGRFVPFYNDTRTYQIYMTKPAYVYVYIYDVEQEKTVRDLCETKPLGMGYHYLEWDGFVGEDTPARKAYQTKAIVQDIPGNIIVLDERTNIKNGVLSSNSFDPYIGETVQITFQSDADAYYTINIKSETGLVVRNLATNELKNKGTVIFEWDGLDAAGNTVPAFTRATKYYTIDITATSKLLSNIETKKLRVGIVNPTVFRLTPRFIKGIKTDNVDSITITNNSVSQTVIYNSVLNYFYVRPLTSTQSETNTVQVNYSLKSGNTKTENFTFYAR